MGDEVGRGTQDMGGRAVVALQADDGGAREILVEAQDVVDLRAAPAIDRLVVVADAADVDGGVCLTLPLRGRVVAKRRGGVIRRATPTRAATRRDLPPRGGGGPLRQEPQPQILRGVGVLVLVDEDVFELAVVVLQDVRIVAEDPDRMAQKVAEVAGVQGLQPFLVGAIEFAALAVAEASGVAFGNLGRPQSLVLPAVDHHGELPRRPTLVVEVFGLDELLYEADYVVGVEDREIRPQAGEFGMPAQEFHADRMERAEPRHALGVAFADQQADAALHLARGLVGEGDGEDLRGVGEAEVEDMRDARGEHARLAGAGAGQHQHGAFGRLDGEPLFGVEPLQIVGCGGVALPRRHGARRNARRLRGARCARAGHGLLVEEGHVVGKVRHRPNVVIRGRKTSKRRRFVPPD